MRRNPSAIAGALALALAAPGAQADDFYKGKQIRLIVSADAGTTYDSYARMLADPIGAHIPGAPTIIIQNMPGASGLTATNYMANVAPRDGTVIAVIDLDSPLPGRFSEADAAGIEALAQAIAERI